MNKDKRSRGLGSGNAGKGKVIKQASSTKIVRENKMSKRESSKHEQIDIMHQLENIHQLKLVLNI